ncbi:MAG: hypothetical protein IKI29_06770 [Clostridia bacterium]|nr:hypothetical protein [Clostridia bacterium]
MNYVIVNKMTKKTNRTDFLSPVLALVPGEKTVIDAKKTDYISLVDSLQPQDALYLIGGDGTLNYFFNEIDPDRLENEIYFYSLGSGNDFFRDLGFHDTFVRINDYIKNLPVVTTATYQKRYFLGAGLGLEGATVYYSETDVKKKNKNFVVGAFKAFARFKPYGAAITFDGQTRRFENIYLATVMKGRYVGSGMLLAPGQDRTDADGKVTLVVVHAKNKFAAFPALFKLLTKSKRRSEKNFFVYSGKEFEIHANAESYLFLDGEPCPMGKDYAVSARTQVLTTKD